MSAPITVLAGGVGAARFLSGFVQVADPARVTAICNVGDDFEWNGLTVCPDIDTVVYTLAELEGEFGWGVRDDTHTVLGALEALGDAPWFRIGDRDLATHVWRTARLRAGEPLSAVTVSLTRARGIASTVLPVTDDPHPTVVQTADGELAFQEYFVARRASDTVTGFRFPGATAARPAPGVIEAIERTSAVILAPSNPFVSIGALLEVPGVRRALETTHAPRVAVSPIVGNAAIKGPAADMLRALGHEGSALGVARLYAGLIDCFVLDVIDAALAPAVEALGMRVHVTDTMMTSAARKVELAREVLASVGIEAAEVRGA